MTFNDIFPNVVKYFNNYLKEGCNSSDCEIGLTKKLIWSGKNFQNFICKNWESSIFGLVKG